MSGVDIAGLVERLRAAINLGDRTGSRGKRPENIYNVADGALTALLAQTAELAEARELIASMQENGGEIAAAIERAGMTPDTWIVRALDRACEQWDHFAEAATEATRQHDEALAALKASEERGERLVLELAEQREATAFADENRTFQLGRVEKLIAERDRANEQIAVLEGALAPFAREADEWHDDVSDDHRSLSTEPDNDYAHPGSETVFTIGDLRRARSVLENGPAVLADATKKGIRRNGLI